MPKAPGPDTQKLIGLRPGKCVFIGKPAAQVAHAYDVVRRHVPGARFAAEAREGGCLVTRIDDGSGGQ